MPAVRRASPLAALLLLVLTAAPGCGGRRLETGYEYTPLGATPVQRRAYYAGPFSPEARDAMMSEDREGSGSTGPGSRRPGN